MSILCGATQDDNIISFLKRFRWGFCFIPDDISAFNQLELNVVVTLSVPTGQAGVPKGD